MAKTIKKNTEKKASSKVDVPKNVESKKATQKTKEKEVELTTEVAQEPTLFTKIYGNETKKEIVPFPDSELQTQTKNIIKEYNIDVAYLPENILNAVNDLVRDFSYFVQNKNMVNMISVIMDKDLVALNLLKQWIEPNSSLLLQLKKENGIEDNLPIVQNSNVVVNNNNVNQVINSMPSNPNTNVPNNINVHNINQPIQNLSVHNTNPFIPREPVSTYQHTNNSQVFGENKNAHHEMMTAAAPSILATNTAQQNHAYVPEPIDMTNFLRNYASSILDSIKGTFQMNHWGYIPMDVLNGILSKCDNTYKDEVFNNGAESYLVISDNKESVKTETFSIQ